MELLDVKGLVELSFNPVLMFQNYVQIKKKYSSLLVSGYIRSKTWTNISYPVIIRTRDTGVGAA
jgi:hypothetical protein